MESAKPAVVETLLGYGAEVHVRGGKLRETPLHIASRVPDGDRCALMLLKSGAGPNLTTDDGQTPVHVAARHGNVTTLKLLLEDGGDPMFKSKVRKSIQTIIYYRVLSTSEIPSNERVLIKGDPIQGTFFNRDSRAYHA